MNLKSLHLKKLTVVPPIVSQVPSAPVHDLLSQPSGKGKIKEIIKPSPEHKLEDLQPSQRPTIGPSEQAQPRRSERIHLQHDKTIQAGRLQDLKLAKIQRLIPVL